MVLASLSQHCQLNKCSLRKSGLSQKSLQLWLMGWSGKTSQVAKVFLWEVALSRDVRITVVAAAST